MRDKNLDLNKGLAIMLVVFGHTIQNLDKEFDQNLLFSIIYSFHMPFFIMLSGASASFWVNNFSNDHGIRQQLRTFFSRVGKSVVLLLLPFYTWSTVTFIVSGNRESFKRYLVAITHRTDLSLWFLPCLFWCILYLAVGLLLIEILIVPLTKKRKHVDLFQRLDTRLVMILIVWLMLRTKIVDFLGTGMANFFHGGLFFLVGIYLQNNLKRFTKPNYVPLLFVTFLSLSPFWSRVNENNFTNNVPHFINGYYIGVVFTMLVAMTGSMMLFLTSAIYGAKLHSKLSTILDLLGNKTLGIYALHGWFILVKPYLVAPLAISLALTITISYILILNTFFLGKMPNFAVKNVSFKFIQGKK